MIKKYTRWQEQAIYEALKYRRVILLEGARQCGKTTLAKDLNLPQIIYRTLDEPQLLEAALTDPEGFVSHGDELMIIDEVQRAPILLPIVKKNVDENQNYGRFLLTGSANIRSLPSATESLAGRVHKIRLRPLALGEVHGNPPQFIHNAFEGKFNIHKPNSNHSYNKDTYLSMAFYGGYPEVKGLPEERIRRWHKDYIDTIIEHDLKDISNIRRKDGMYKLLNVLAAWSTKFMNVSSICGELSIKRPTVESYINALEVLYLVECVRPWTKTDYTRISKKDKLLMSDTGLMASILRWSLEQIRLDSDRCGKLIETFVYTQLAAISEANDAQYQIYHYHDNKDREIDFIIENQNGDILAIEVKAGSAVNKSMFKHMQWFKENLADKRKFKGIVLYTGEHALSFGDNMWAVPINSLWS